MRFTWDHNVPLRWFEVFVNTIEAMLVIAKSPWNDFVPKTIEDSTSPNFVSRIQVGQLRDGLQAKHIISALYEVGLAMAATHAKDTLYAGIVVNGRPIAFLRYGLKRTQLGVVPFNTTEVRAGNYAAKSLSASPSEQLSNSSALSARRSGTVVNPEDPRFEVTFEFDGTPAKESAVCVAFMDAIATAAQYDNEQPGGEITAWSSGREVSIIMHKDPSAATFTWGDVKTALAVIWREIIIGYNIEGGPVWEDVTFLISYEGRTIGGGFISSSPESGPPSDTTVAK